MAEIQFKTLRQEVANAIRQKILEGELKPGERIVEQEIASDLGVSRGPVREALREIERDGLIEYARNIGCSVKQVSDEDVFEIYVMRATYEKVAIQLCEGILSNAAKEQMKDALEKMKQLQDEEFDLSIAYDNQFHGAMIGQIALPRLQQLWTNLNPGNVITYYLSNSNRAATMQRQFEIHKPVYEAYLTQDPRTMCSAVMEHYMLTTRRRLREKGSSLEAFCSERSLAVPDFAEWL